MSNKMMKKFFLFFLIFTLYTLHFTSTGYAFLKFHEGVLECGDCHIVDFNTAEGNVNLCLSCHTGGGRAGNLAFYTIDQATITETGLSGFSHRWDASPYKVDVATLPTRVQKYVRGKLVGEDWIGDVKLLSSTVTGQWRLACSSCHNSKTYSYYRDPEQRDKKMCLNCHRIMKHSLGVEISSPTAWEKWETVRVYTDKKMNHPVGRYGSAWIGCSTCHLVHGNR